MNKIALCAAVTFLSFPLLAAEENKMSEQQEIETVTSFVGTYHGTCTEKSDDSENNQEETFNVEKMVIANDGEGYIKFNPQQGNGQDAYIPTHQKIVVDDEKVPTLGRGHARLDRSLSIKSKQEVEYRYTLQSGHIFHHTETDVSYQLKLDNNGKQLTYKTTLNGLTVECDLERSDME